ncbi:family 16 glycosylhydrolase [Salmonella enterica]|nr:hypothetical protein [Salmonella enterica subsp. enterica serovar Stuttgart]EIV0973321.1 family 16 glycosylhydrolase [Salmonella enterica]
MNNKSKRSKLVEPIVKLYKKLYGIIAKKKCIAFGVSDKVFGCGRIEKIYVINLERHPQRLARIKGELSQVTDNQGEPLSALLERVTAVDALNDIEYPLLSEVKSKYTLQEQLFVDPRQILPQKLDLDMEIKMSKQEVAVACSHIKVWKEIAKGNERFSLVLEDDICLHSNFASLMEKCWTELNRKSVSGNIFDILFISFKEVDLGAEKTKYTENTFKIFRGIWYMSGYVLSKEGAKKLLSLLPVVGPVDLWVNHKFDILNAIMFNKSIISQRDDETSSNFYSILPVLSKIGVINDNSPSVFKTMLSKKPVFAMGKGSDELTSLAMSLSMLGYRCCSDVEKLPEKETVNLFKNSKERIFDAYVNVKNIEDKWEELFNLYPNAQAIVFNNGYTQKELDRLRDICGRNLLILDNQNSYQWKPICEFLNVAPPVGIYPKMNGIPIRKFEVRQHSDGENRWLIADKSPWIIENSIDRFEFCSSQIVNELEYYSNLKVDNINFWFYRDDTFPGNECLFTSSNLKNDDKHGAIFIAKKENMGVRNYSSAAITSRKSFLYGRFEAVLKPPKVSGLVTGVFLHRDSPRQEIDIEFVGNKPSKMLTNVYYNPGAEGARFDYGYRGTPYEIELGYDATEEFHKYSIEWDADEIKWFVDDKLVHRRSHWGPTPIPHLPMQFHVNLWPTRSRELAGKINDSLLPAAMQLKNIYIGVHKLSAVHEDNLEKHDVKVRGAEFEKVKIASIF